MAKAVKPVPDGYYTVTPYLIINGAASAIEFYKKAFGAKELFRMGGPDGKIGHAEIKIGNSPIMLADENPGMGYRGPLALGGTPVGILRLDINTDNLSTGVGHAHSNAATDIGTGTGDEGNFTLELHGRSRSRSARVRLYCSGPPRRGGGYRATTRH